LIKNRRKIYSTVTDTAVNIKDTKPIGVTLPFNNQNGVFNLSYTNVEQVLSNLKNLLMTKKGERIMQPDFGTDLEYYLFEQITDELTFKESLLGEIRTALTMWMPYVTISEVDMEVNVADDGRVSEPHHAVAISLTLFITGTNIYLPVRILISDTGTLTIT
jgi:phage baseplate assembly protein W